jgi:archaeal type IV pilus assembly protein PilA
MMKKMWKIRKDKSAVSPVIATILMVAITVVLAAVLYVMVMGFGNGGGSTPAASLRSESTGTAHQYKITVLSVSTTTMLYSNIAIVNSGTHTGITPAVAGSTALGAGDSFVVTFSAAGQQTVSLRDNATSNNIATLTIQSN